MGRKRMNYPDERARVLIDAIVLAPPTDNLEIFQGSEQADYRKLMYERFQCRQMALSLTPSQYWPHSCNESVCPVAGSVFGIALNCECDPTGSTSGLCYTNGGQCECKPNVGGRK
jgi:coxsackievirus/adenovirus receptor